jgi:zinc/manganese transport system substrate-binding protein
MVCLTGARRRAVLAATVALALVGAALAGCGSGGGADPAGPAGPAARSAAAGTATPATGAISVVAAENFWGDITRQIGGDQVRVRAIISDPNTDPHQYESDPADAAAIARAGFVIVNGLGYDDFVDKLLAASPSPRRDVLSVAKTVGVGGEGANPHLWYSPAYVVAAARAIEARLAKERPAAAGTFEANLTTFLTGEGRVSAIINQIRARYAGTPVAYTERVPGYLVTAAGLTLGTPASFSQSIEDGNDPSPADTAAFDAALSGRKVRVLLYNAQVTSPVTAKARALAKNGGVPVIGVTETLPPGEKDFQTWQADQAGALLAALGG